MLHVLVMLFHWAQNCLNIFREGCKILLEDPYNLIWLIICKLTGLRFRGDFRPAGFGSKSDEEGNQASVATTQVRQIWLNVLSIQESSQLWGIRESANGVTAGLSCPHGVRKNNDWLQRNMGINIIRLDLPSCNCGSSKSCITRWQSDVTRNG
jgi:hypothetical protein